MVTFTIIALLLVIGVPAMGEFVADQRVRTVASDITSEIALARAKAIETSRRVYMEKLGVNWNNGWRLYADNNDNGVYDAGVDLELKRFEGFSSGSIYVCTFPVGAFLNQIAFRPDGRIVRTGVLPRWIGRIAYVMVPINLAFVPSIYFGNDPAFFYAANGWGTAALMGFLTVVWILIASIGIMRTRIPGHRPVAVGAR